MMSNRMDQPAVIGADVLSDLLHTIRLGGALYFDVDARAPWVAETPRAAALRAGMMREFEHIISFHILLAGRC
jgi:cupin